MMDIHSAYCAYFWVNILVSISLFSWISSLLESIVYRFSFWVWFSWYSCVVGQCTLG